MATTNSVNHHLAQLTAYVTPASVGAVIGRKGAKILQIQKDAGKQVRISVISSSPSPTSDKNTSPSTYKEDIQGRVNENSHHLDEIILDGEENWIPVVIRGDSYDAIKAAKMVMNALDDPADMDDVVLEIPVHRSKHSAIIGKKGANIMKLSADHNVRIMVPPPSRDTVETGYQNIVQLEGNLFAVENCLADIKQILSSQPTTVGVKSTHELPPDIHGVKVLIAKDHIKVMISPEHHKIVPSFNHLRNIGRSTKALIRRKRVEVSPSEDSKIDETPTSEDESDSEKSNETIEDEAIPSSSSIVTELLITSQSKKPKDENARIKCYIELHKVLQTRLLNNGDIDRASGDDNDEPANTNKRRPHHRRRVGGRGGKANNEIL